ncbi:hypothetical protein VTK73DRAFT_10055 [Phialemonium thermophilum]|uniref:Uncharacterized protein n=1 Tax=Phialemonium thermophilum TaxID=223376 RepID=A0ABR3VYX1_9PEZI
MASSQPRGGERMIHQDFIARIRYSNALPPPPIPPKLLEIPNTGLSSGQYTNPGFASRLAREQPLNIEADAELGMPLDLVGMPGVFDGDESSIQAPAQPPPIHPRDRQLLRPLSTLGKPKASDAAVSFLRRTEYISAQTTKSRPGDVFLRPSSGNASLKRPEKRKTSPEPDKDSPAYMRRKIDRSFEVAQQHLADPSRVRHPSNKRGNLRVVDAYPMLPDLDAFPDSGAYVTVKFTHNPVPSGSDRYDTRLLSGVFKPIERTEAEEQAFEAAMEAYERDPARNPKPNNMMNYDFYLADSPAAAEAFRRRFDVDDPDRDNDDLYPRNNNNNNNNNNNEDDAGSDAPRCFRFQRVRAYETAQETELDHASKYSDEIILAYNDHDSTTDGGQRRQKAVYYYPVMQRTTIRSQRTKNIARTIGGVQPEQEEQVVDQLDVTVDEPGEELRSHMLRFRERPLGFPEDEEEEEDGEEEERGDRRRDDDDSRGRREGGGSDRGDDGDDEARSSPAANGTRGSAGASPNGRVADEERDAEGDEEEED